MNTFLGTGALGAGEPVERRFDLLGAAGLVGRGVVIGAVVLAGMWRARTGARLVEACGVVTLVALLIGPQRFWPWYAALPLGLLALTPGRTSRWVGLVFGACVLLASPIEGLPIDGTGPIGFGIQTLVFRAVRLVPLLALVVLGVAEWRAAGGGRGWYPAFK